MTVASTTRNHVLRILRELGIERPPVDIMRVAQHVGATVRLEPFEGDLSGALVRQDGQRAVIGVNAQHHDTRRRFTIAHELGHLLLHKGDPVHFDRAIVHVNLRNSISSKAVDWTEVEANRFAAELLMPEPFLRRDIGELRAQSVPDVMDEELISILADRYGVSAQAMTFRLANLGLAASS